jgi:hypothetical protein
MVDALEASYKYIDFVKIEATSKTGKWACKTKAGVALGQVSWYPGWRQYCYFPGCQAVYSAGCLSDIADFLKKQNTRH